MIKVLQREWVYLWYHMTILLEQIAPYWLPGTAIGPKCFVLYIMFSMAFAFLTGMVVNIVLSGG